METKANFVLIGAVTLLGLFGTLALLVWFAKVELDRQFALYQVLFEDVSGLGMAADVRYNGLSVGQVTGLELDPDFPGRVRVLIEVAADTPVKTDTIAQLNSQGVTGVAFVGLTGGSPDAPLLLETEDQGEIPLIPSERSAVQALTEDAPDLVAEAVAAIRDIRSFLTVENRRSVMELLRNLENASGQLDVALQDFSEISRTVSEGTAEITKFTGRLDAIGSAVQTTLTNIDKTLEATNKAIAEVAPTLQSAQGTLSTAEQTLSDVQDFVQTRVPQMADELSAAVGAIETATTDLSAQMGGVLTRFDTTAETATRRFAEMEATIATLDVTLAEARESLAAVESASVYFEDLMSGEGSALIQEARAALASIESTLSGLNSIVETDAPAIMADIRSAVASASAAVDRVASNVTAATDKLDPLVQSGEATLEAATTTFRNADRTLANLDSALATGEAALDVAQRTFARADETLAADLGPAVTDVRTAAGQFETTMSALAEDIPAITRDLRDVMARALGVIEDIDDTVSASAPPLQGFAREGLPEFTKFAREAQQLVNRLEQLARRIERDPPRFFFGNALPEYRR